jgi:hypothetical protein
MGRPVQPLPAEKIEAALDYLQRAADRRADYFTCGSKETRRSLARLRRQALTLRRPDLVLETNVWLSRNVTPGGRRAMLSALRQQQFVKRGDDCSGRNLHLTAASRAEVAALAERLGMSPGAAVAAVVKAALADEAFLARHAASAARSRD